MDTAIHMQLTGQTQGATITIGNACIHLCMRLPQSKWSYQLFMH